MDVPHTDLDCIIKDYSDETDLLREVLKHWLRNGVDPSWKTVVRALRSPIVNKENVAMRLESMYCATVQHRMDESSIPIQVKESEGNSVTMISITNSCKAYYSS